MTPDTLPRARADSGVHGFLPRLSSGIHILSVHKVRIRAQLKHVLDDGRARHVAAGVALHAAQQLRSAHRHAKPICQATATALGCCHTSRRVVGAAGRCSLGVEGCNATPQIQNARDNTFTLA